MERPRRSEIAQVSKQQGKVIEERRGIGMVGAERLLPDRQCALDERSRLGIVPKRAVPVLREQTHQIARRLFRTPRRRNIVADQRQGEPIEPPRPRPGPWIIEGFARIDRR